MTAGACGGGTGPDDAPRRSSTTTASTSGEPTTTSAPPPACPAVPERTDASEPAVATGDVDGDGRPDDLTTFRDAGGGWHLHLALAAGGGAELPVPTVGDASVQVLGGADVDGDGAEEVWARTGAGASAAIVGLFQLVGCTLVATTFAGGEPADFAVGGTVGTAAGLECGTDPAGPDLTSYTATSTGGDTYDVTASEWALEGTTLVAGRTTTTTVAATDPLMGRASSFSCGDVGL